MKRLGLIQITSAAPEYAEAIQDAIEANGGDAKIVSAPQHPGLCLFTEGLVERAPAERDYLALQAALQSYGDVHAVMLNRAAADALHDIGGLSGLCRSIRIERSDKQVFALSFHDTHSIHEDARNIVRALSLPRDDYTLTQRGVCRDVPSEEVSPPPTSASLPGTPVWLVSGGARGVTADCTIELARRTGGSFILLGRSDVTSWPSWLEPETDLKALRGALARNKSHPDVPPTPKEIDRYARKLLAGAEITSTLNAIEAVGARARYVQVDIGNQVGLRAEIDRLVTEEGTITGLIHGAGVLSDGLVDQLDLNSFETVFAPKVTGLETILSCLDLQALTHIGLFSSASAVFGNQGQANYAAANTWLNNVAVQLAATMPATQVKAFCWGPWHGGMVDDALARMFAERGIGLITRPEGARIFADQLLNAPHDQVRFVVGDEWGDV
ncbi:SDR family NAD(P)-dependent oxidoreductase [uncultured Hyphomonas sp.]|uniref:SDR family NAD(P)-dependent oxidoreductase n=1 Tax=uncultured Hyphomonas sp. TaxID=225298 RepID=UPI003748AC2D